MLFSLLSCGWPLGPTLLGWEYTHLLLLLLLLDERCRYMQDLHVLTEAWCRHLFPCNLQLRLAQELMVPRLGINGWRLQKKVCCPVSRITGLALHTGRKGGSPTLDESRGMDSRKAFLAFSYMQGNGADDAITAPYGRTSSPWRPLMAHWEIDYEKPAWSIYGQWETGLLILCDVQWWPIHDLQ